MGSGRTAERRIRLHDQAREDLGINLIADAARLGQFGLAVLDE